MGILVVLAVLGLILLPAGIVAAVFNVRAFRCQPRLLPVPVAALSLGIGIALAILPFSYAYSLDPWHRVLGIPFPAAVFARHGKSWEGFAGPLTGPLMLANALVGFVLPQVVIMASRGRNWRSLKRETRGPNPRSAWIAK